MMLGAMIHHYDNERTHLFCAKNLQELNDKVALWCESMSEKSYDPSSSNVIVWFVNQSNGDWMYLTQGVNE